MPFTALNQKTNELIYAFNYESATEIRLNESMKDLACPFCGIKMFPKQGDFMRLHFAHSKKCKSKMEYHPETAQHLQGKILIYERLKKEYAKVKKTDIEVVIEFPVPQAGENGRIADVAVIFKKTGSILVHECQLSRISTENLQKRTEDYESAGVDVIWHIGKEVNTTENSQYLLQKFGGYEIFNYSSNQETF